MNWAAELLLQSWAVLLDSAPYLLLGFVATGLFHAFLPASLVNRHLGSGRVASVVKASLLGVPLPLCSCGVLPAALGLRAKGAGKGAVFSFLVSTPETGVDSIAVTYGLMGPLMAVARPIAAFFTALLAGLAETVFGREEPIPPAKAPTLEPFTPQRSIVERLADGMRFAFGDFYRGIVPWLALGILAAGAVAAFIPEGFIERTLSGPWAMPAALAAGIPLYVCATASTPIAAALVAKGLSPGAALVFLLSGPATNAASIVVLSRTFGWASTARYLAAIAAGSLAAGVALDALSQGWLATTPFALAPEEEAVLPGVVCAALLLVAYLRVLFLQRGRPAGFT